MRFEIPINSVLFERKEIKVVHKDKEIWFSKAPFTDSAFVATDEPSAIFTHINRFMESLPENEQDIIFQKYEAIRNTFDVITDFEEAKQTLANQVASLYEHFNYTRLHNWLSMNYRQDINLPDSKYMLTSYNEIDDRNHTRDKTYILQDYFDLIVLIVQLRPVILVWGEYIKTFSNVVGTSFKEYSAYELIAMTDAVNNKAMQKLKVYVEAITPAEGSREAIVEFIGSEDYVSWQLAMLIVRKVCLFDVRGKYDDSPVIIKHISTHIREKIRHSSNSFNGEIKNKSDTDTSNQSEENQLSKFEAFKTKELTSSGDRVFIERMVSNPLKLAHQLDPNVPMELVTEFYQYVKNTNNPISPLSKVQNNLLKMVLAPVIPHKGIDYLNLEKHNCIAAAQAVLWHNGHYLIAGILSANRGSDLQPDMVNTNNDSRSKVNPELKEKLLSLFPFTWKTKNGKEIDAVSKNIDYLVNALSEEMWILRLPANMVEKVNILQPNRFRLVVPPNIKNIVLEFAIYLASRKPVTINSL